MLFNYFLVLISLLLISGLVIDAGLLEMEKIGLQTAADAAAQEGMMELARNHGTWATAAAAQATKNGYTNGVNGATVTIVNPPTTGNYAGDVMSVQATISQSSHNFFMALVNQGNSTVAAVAVAKVLPTCIWVMNPSGANTYNGSTSGNLWLASSASRNSCGVYVNTQPGQNLGVDYFATLTATRIRAIGPSTSNVSSGTIWPLPRFGAAQKNDPLAYVTAPLFSSCTTTNFTASGGTSTLNPGTYCGGITISNNATVTFNPGLYIVTGGLSWANCQVYGSGVTLYLTQGGGSSFGTVSMNSATVSMSAPTSSSGGGITGVLFFGDRSWVAHGSQNVLLNGSTVTADGLWYVLNTGIHLNYASFTGPNYAGMIVDNIYNYQGNINGVANYAPLSNVSPLHWEDGVLVQ